MYKCLYVHTVCTKTAVFTCTYVHTKNSCAYMHICTKNSCVNMYVCTKTAVFTCTYKKVIHMYKVVPYINNDKYHGHDGFNDVQFEFLPDLSRVQVTKKLNFLNLYHLYFKNS